jgi:class 3 adenylate cyclase/tetratricopeptide (TPR) repeat protein
MECPRCHYANADGARFCGECGASLTRDVTCAGCGQANPVGQQFCNGCGQRLGESAGAAERAPRAYTPKHLAEKILTSRVALEGERKQVTVLFADVKGSMELAEQLDPEAWHTILDRFFAILAEGVHRFEGTVNQFTGDGIMALFGAPIAHEDHAQRACWAALHLRDTLREYAEELKRVHGIAFAVRMGLNSGEVVVGKIGDDLRMDYTAQGHVVGLAQRMEQLAGADRAYVTEHTAALAAGYFRLRDLGAFTVKGLREPLRVHELEGVGAHRTRLDVSRARGFSRFVGRQDEMEVLEGALARALGGDGLVVGVVAEPGVGKSRLCWELAARCRARGIAVHGAHGVAHGRGVPFLPMLEFLRAWHGITPEDSERAAREKIAGRLLLLDASLADALPLVFDFLGVPDPARPLERVDPEARQRRLHAVVKQVVHARSRSEPAVLLFEDLHWFDGSSDAMLAALVEAVAGTRTLVVVNFRPEYQAAWMERPFHQQLPLRPLGPGAIAELLHELLGADPSLGDLADRIRARTSGNPFFIEETVLGLAEAGTLVGTKGGYRLVAQPSELALPASVQSVLAARIDRLPARDKEVLQAAAVIGKEFGEPVLRRIAGLPEPHLAAALRTLTAAELVHETALYPEVAYAFKHPLTQEVALRSQLAERRKRTHAAVARAIEETSAGRLDEQAALLAHHWEAAGEAWLAADWHRRAAEWVGRRDRVETLRHWQQVCALLREVPESPETLALRVLARDHVMMNAQVLGQMDLATIAFKEGMELAARLDTPAPRIGFLTRYGMGRMLTAGETAVGLEHLAEARRLAEQSGVPFLRYIALSPLCTALTIVGRLADAIAASEETEALGKGDPDLGAEVTGFSIWGALLANRAAALAYLGRFEEGRRDLARAIEIGRARRDNEVLVIAHGKGVVLYELMGDAERALAHGRQAAEVAGVIGNPTRSAIAHVELGQAQVLGARWDEAIELLTAALATMRTRRVALSLETNCLRTLAEAHLGAGALERARELADEAVGVASARSHVIQEIQALCVRAHTLLATDGARAAAEITTSLDRATALVQSTGACALEPRVRIERARLARATGDEAGRRRELREAHRLFIEMGAPICAEQVAHELGSSVESTSEIFSTSRT